MNREAAVHTGRYIGIYRDISDNETELGKTKKNNNGFPTNILCFSQPTKVAVQFFLDYT